MTRERLNCTILLLTSVIVIQRYYQKDIKTAFETTLEQLQANQTRLQELEMKLNEEDGKVSSLNRRVMLLEVCFG